MRTDHTQPPEGGGKEQTMKKTEKAEGFPGTDAGGREGQTAEKPRRGRKPKAVKLKEEAAAAAAAGTEAVQETDTVTETDTVSGKTEEIPAQQEAGQEAENAQEAAEMPAAETGSVMQETVSEGQAAASPVTAQEADTEPENDTAGEPAAEAGNTREGAAGESNGTVGPGTEPEEPTEEEPEKADGEGSGEEPERLPAPAISTQVTGSPLKRMKQEFSERSQIIREQMRNIQNAFITIGFQLHWIRENNMFRVLNYKNVYDYAEKEYGLKKTTCCNFISIIENYAERDENGEVIESIADCYRNYSASQLVAMLGMNEDMRQQVSPDMSVRAINRLRKGGPEPGMVETSPAPEEEPAPVKEPETEKDAEDPAPEEEPVSGETDHVEETEAEEMQEESPETAADDTAREEGPEGTETMETEAYGDDGEEYVGDAAYNEGDTLAEIDSYSDYRSMADELDLIMRHVFTTAAPVRVKIVCVQG